MDFKQKILQWDFVQGNKKDVLALLGLRANVILIDVLNLQKRFLIGIIYCGIGLIFFLIMLLSLIFGINTVITDIELKKWFFFGLAIFSIVMFLLMLGITFMAFRKSMTQLNSSVHDLSTEINFILGNQNINQVMDNLEDTLKDV